MKHIIIPTDLTIRSLQPIHDVVRLYEEEKVQITLLHLLEMPIAVGDLLFRLHRTDRHALPVAFKNACEVIAGRYKRNIHTLHTSLQYGSTSRFLSNLLTGMKADAIFLQENARFTKPFKESVDLLPMLPRTGVAMVYTAAGTAQEVPATIGDLLLIAEPAKQAEPALQTC